MYKRNNQPPASITPPPLKERPKEIIAQWQNALHMASLLLRSIQQQSIQHTFAKLKKYTQLKKKYASFIGNKLHLLFRRKQREQLKAVFGALISNRISYYTLKKDEHERLKQTLKSKAAGLIGIIGSKLLKSKSRLYLQQLKMRSSLKSKLGHFKNLHLFNLLVNLYISKLKGALSKLDICAKSKVTSLRRLSRLQKMVHYKKRNLLQQSLLKLRINALNAKASESKANEEVKEEKVAPKQVQQPQTPLRSDRQLQAQLRKLQTEQRNLNQKKRGLERELSKLQSENQKTLNDFKREIERLQVQNSELVFNHDLLEQNNQELEREYQNKQKGGRKKLSKAQIWENVYNNLIHFLNINKDKTITKAALLECLEMPLVPCSLNLQQINEQNQILSELLEEYKKNFPQPEGSSSSGPIGQLLPFDVIRKQNRYYYMVLQVLSEWGLPGSKELQQLNNDLTAIQKKLAQ